MHAGCVDGCRQNSMDMLIDLNLMNEPIVKREIEMNGLVERSNHYIYTYSQMINNTIDEGKTIEILILICCIHN